MKPYELVLQPEEAAGSIDYKRILFSQYQVDPSSVQHIIPVKKSIDARGRQVKIRLWVDVYFSGEPLPSGIQTVSYPPVHDKTPVIIIGCGPAGMFAALKLIELGLKPVIIERGKDVRARRRDLAVLNKTGQVNPDSNYCFGEGGAGTYSDGKLYTRSTKRGDTQGIIEIFIRHGADPSIAIETHPHIGTNKLPQVISSMRESILNAGGEIHFNTVLDELLINSGRIKGIQVSAPHDRAEKRICIPAQLVILSTGHSARNIFEMLHRQKIKIEAKALAIGVRIEHPQHIIDAQQYHCDIRSPYLPPASYKLTFTGGKRSLYSFCMCPGGIIAPAATAPGEIVVNGWSPSKRNNPFANSGMVVNINLEDLVAYRSDGELAALRFQQEIEHKACQAGGGHLKAPAQRLVDFMDRKFSSSLPDCSYIPGVTSNVLDDILPSFISNTLREGLRDFGKKMKGYLTREAILVGVESRTSSPVRIPRHPVTLMHEEVEGLFPCGEGAGYAGGIVSAAIDGQRCAEQCVHYFKQLR